jgi:hypothetical protein
MNEYNDQIPVSKLKSSLKAYYAYLVSKKNVITFVSIGFAILSLTYAFIKKPVYIAKTSFIINEFDKGVGSSLLSLAGQIGISTGSGISLNDDKITFLIGSRRVMAGSLLKELQTEDGSKVILVNRFISYYKLKDAWKNDTCMVGFEDVKNKDYDKLNYQENAAIDKVISIIEKSKLLNFEAIKKKSLVSQSSGIITIQFNCKDELACKALIENLYKELTDFYTINSTKRYKENYDLIKYRADSLIGLIQEKENSLGAVTDENFKIIKSMAKVNQYRLQKEVEMLYIIYGEVLKNKELAKFTLDQQKPAFQVVDAPTLPLEKKESSKIFYALFGLVLGAFAGLVWFSYRFIRNANAQ